MSAVAAKGNELGLRTLPVQPRAQRRIDAIAAATKEAIATFGIDYFTTNDVARIAGSSIGVVYRYFPDRMALIEHVYPGGYLTATTVAELEALPPASVVLDEAEDVYQVAGDSDGRDWGVITSGGVATYSDAELLAEHPVLRILYRGVIS